MKTKQVQCEHCYGQGYFEEDITAEMAIDAGEPSMEGDSFETRCPVCGGDGWYVKEK